MNSETIPFTKMQGVGNDFVLIDGRGYSGMDWAGLAVEICDRRLGVGSDGLLVIDHSNIADAAMRMYNPDGTPDFCGNGIRCVARYMAEEKIGVRAFRPPGVREHAAGESLTHTFTLSPSHRSENEVGSEDEGDSLHPTHNAQISIALSLATLAGIRQTVTSNPGTGHCTVSVDMGRPRFDPADIPMLVPAGPIKDFLLDTGGESVRITSLSTGTAHTIVIVDNLPEDEEFFAKSPLIEHHLLFPERTSVLWMVVENAANIRLRIWERGAGETWGCGTGACAAAVAAKLHGLVQAMVHVHSKGGTLLINWDEDGSIQMTGPAEYVYTGTYAT